MSITLQTTKVSLTQKHEVYTQQQSPALQQVRNNSYLTDRDKTGHSYRENRCGLLWLSVEKYGRTVSFVSWRWHLEQREGWVGPVDNFCVQKYVAGKTELIIKKHISLLRCECYRVQQYEVPHFYSQFCSTATAAVTGDWLTDNWSVSNSSSVHVFEPFFWTRQLLDNFRLKARAIFSRIDF